MIKAIYPESWFYEHFQTKELNGNWVCYGTINGYDHSFMSDTEDNARLLALAHLQKNKEIYNQENLILQNKLAAAMDEKERENVMHKREFTELTTRFRSKLMSVYYMLDAVSKTGTHREKQTVIMYHKVVLEGLINEGNDLSWNTDNLPF